MTRPKSILVRYTNANQPFNLYLNHKTLNLNNATNKDIKNFTFWVENCSAQNKCWWFFTALCDAVNNERNMDLQSVTLKYFEKGQSFMRADSYHRLVEKGMNLCKKMCMILMTGLEF